MPPPFASEPTNVKGQLSLVNGQHRTPMVCRQLPMTVNQGRQFISKDIGQQLASIWSTMAADDKWSTGLVVYGAARSMAYGPQQNAQLTTVTVDFSSRVTVMDV